MDRVPDDTPVDATIYRDLVAKLRPAKPPRQVPAPEPEAPISPLPPEPVPFAPTEAAIERFWSRVDTRGECWLWDGGEENRGYGYISVQGKTYAAHRFSYMLTNGPIPEGMVICHHCDNPPCVNPAHLFLGTRSDNAQDMVAKGRHGAARHPQAPIEGSGKSKARHGRLSRKARRAEAQQHREMLIMRTYFAEQQKRAWGALARTAAICGCSDRWVALVVRKYQQDRKEPDSEPTAVGIQYEPAPGEEEYRRAQEQDRARIARELAVEKARVEAERATFLWHAIMSNANLKSAATSEPDEPVFATTREEIAELLQIYPERAIKDHELESPAWEAEQRATLAALCAVAGTVATPFAVVQHPGLVFILIPVVLLIWGSAAVLFRRERMTEAYEDQS